MEGRYRSENTMKMAPPWFYSRVASNCGTGAPLTAYPNYGNIGHVRTMSDIRDPLFHQKRKQGIYSFNPCQASTSHVRMLPNTGTFSYRNSTSCNGGVDAEHQLSGDSLAYAIFAHAYPNYTVPSIYSADDVNDLIREVSTKVLADRNGGYANFVESIATAKENVRLLPGLMSEIQKIVRRPGFKRSLVGSKVKAVGSAYLAVRYGLLPLMSDVQHVLQGFVEEMRRETYRAKAQLVAQDSLELKNLAFTGGVTHFSSNGVLTHTVDVRAMQIADFIYDASVHYGINNSNLITLPWELLPMSFVVDWFVNVGDFISAITPANSKLLVVGSSVSVRSVSTMTSMNWSATSVAGWQHTGQVSGGVFQSVETYNRSPVLAAPGLVLKSNFGFGLSGFELVRTLDAAALVIQKTFKRK